MKALAPYRAKRDFKRTDEPSGRAARGKAAGAWAGDGAFVVHKHAARRLHYDLRLEQDGVLWSWAVTRGPSLDPEEKRLAVHVEDHPLDYAGFEGVIPKGEYGGGSVIVWDEGRWRAAGDPAAGMKKGHLDFTLEGGKLKGGWHLVRLKPRRGEKRDNWLLIKARDGEARSDIDVLDAEPRSVASGRTVEEVAQSPSPRTRTTRKSGARPAGSAAEKAAMTTGKPDAARRGRKAGPAVRSRPPSFIPPCLATLKETPPTGPEWAHEVKFDGYRIQARIAGGAATLFTRTGLDWSGRFGRALPSDLAGLSCETAVIDGEIVVLDDKGSSSFSALQAALTAGDADGFFFFAFDLLHLDGADLRDEPLLTRKQRLAAFLEDAPATVRFSEHFSEPGSVMLEHACRMGLEGVISKRVDAPYRSGRGLDWIKAKCTQRQEFAIVGYAPSKASGRGLGSILVGYRDGAAWKPAGRVGAGFTIRSAAALKVRLDALRQRSSALSGPAGKEKGIVWVKPELVAEVAFRAWTADHVLRHASYQGLREDKPAQDVVSETPADMKKSGARSKRSPPAKTAATKAAAPLTKTLRAGKGPTLTHPDKVLWPEAGLTKRGLLAHYEGVWPRMKPFIVNRPLAIVRAPDGIDGPRFFQKHASPGMSAAIRVARDPRDGDELLSIADFDGLAALVQLGGVELHVWGCAIDDLERPDQLVFDLDPDEGVPAERVRAAAIEIRDKLAELGFATLPKVSGGKGFHVVAPLKPKADWTAAKGFAHDFAHAVAQAAPDRYTAVLSKKARAGRIFIDYLRNGRGATAVAPYSVRARPKATIALPVTWAELEAGVAPDAFRVDETATQAALAGGDPWKAFKKAATTLKL